MKILYDRLANYPGYNKGDKVWFYRPAHRKEISPKLKSSWEGPYKVVTRRNYVVYWIQKNPRSRLMVVYLNRLAPNQEAARDERA
jgi:hypothetical protein